MRISTISATDKQVMKVYAAKKYDAKNPRIDNYVEVNIPEYVPTIPMDDSVEQIGLNLGMVVNTNWPRTATIVKMSHSLRLPLLRGTTCPVYFEKGTPFLLLNPNDDISNSFLIYI